jgi:hypothetical protein
VLREKLSKYTNEYYGREPEQDDPDERYSNPGSITGLQARVGLKKARVDGPHVSMEKALRPECLDLYDKGQVAVTLGTTVDMPMLANGVPDGTLQPPALGLSCTHPLCYASVQGPADWSDFRHPGQFSLCQPPQELGSHHQSMH